MASGLIGNEVPLTGLRVRVPCPPLLIDFQSVRAGAVMILFPRHFL